MKAARNNTNVLDGVSIDSVDKKSVRYSIAALLGMFALGTIVGIGMTIVGIGLSSWTPKSGAAFRNPSADISETVRVTDSAVEVEAETVENLLTVPESYDADVSNGESLKSRASRALKSEKNKNQKSRIFRKTSSNGSTKKKTVKKAKKNKSARTSSPTTEPTNPPTTNPPVTAPCVCTSSPTPVTAPPTNPPTYSPSTNPSQSPTADKNCPCGVARCDNFYSCPICGIGRCITNPEYEFDPGYDGTEGRPRPPRTCGQAEAVVFQGTLNGPGMCLKLHVPTEGSTLFDEKYPGCTCSALLPTPEPTISLSPTETPYPTDTPSDNPTVSANPTSCVAILDNLVESSFNPAGQPYCFGVSEGDFLTAELTVVSGKDEKSTTDFEFTSGKACTTNLFTEDNGPVNITFAAEADCGNVQLSALLLSGSITVTVKLEQDNNVFTDKAEARVGSADISDVVAIYQIVDGSGTATFQNLPKRSVTFTAIGEGYEFGASGATLYSNTDVDIDLFGFNEPSDIDNNNFHLGLAGWDYKPEEAYAIGITNSSNLVVTTGGKEGLTRVSRTITTSAVMTNMRVRYKFATEEFPQFYGDVFNDYYFVLIRVIPPATGPTADIATASMNNLGFDAFKHSFYASTAAATDWFILEFGDIPQGSIVQVDIGVANVADDAYQSAVEVDRLLVNPQL